MTPWCQARLQATCSDPVPTTYRAPGAVIREGSGQGQQALENVLTSLLLDPCAWDQRGKGRSDRGRLGRGDGDGEPEELMGIDMDSAG